MREVHAVKAIKQPTPSQQPADIISTWDRSGPHSARECHQEGRLQHAFRLLQVMFKTSEEPCSTPSISLYLMSLRYPCKCLRLERKQSGASHGALSGEGVLRRRSLGSRAR